MNRKVLVQGFVRMFIPLVVGTLASVAVGLLVGSLFGFEMKHILLYHRTNCEWWYRGRDFTIVASL